MKLIDLTQTIQNNMPVYPGAPETKLTQSARIDQGGYNDHNLTINMHTGTHIDAPSHMLIDGKQITDFPLSKFISTGIMLDARGKKIIDASIIESKKIPTKSIVLIYTGQDKKFRKQEYYHDYPVIEKSLAKKLVEAKINMVGIDSPSPDKFPFDIHKIFFKNDIMIIENLTNLEQLLEIPKFQIIALPIKCETDGAIARVIAQIK